MHNLPLRLPAHPPFPLVMPAGVRADVPAHDSGQRAFVKRAGRGVVCAVVSGHGAALLS